MLKKVIITFFILLILLFLYSELIQGELFRDSEHNYRIRFPT